MKLALLIGAGIGVFTGCDISPSEMTKARGTQLCHDLNTSLYKVKVYTSKYKVICTNGAVIAKSAEDYKNVSGDIVEQYINNKKGIK